MMMRFMTAISAAKRSGIYNFLYIKSGYQHHLMKEQILGQKGRSVSKTLLGSQTPVPGLVSFCQPEMNTSTGRIQAVIPN